MANNHALCVGYDAMLGTRRGLEDLGIATSGVGETLAEARRPRIVEAAGCRVAVLAHASIFPFGYEARANRPGVAPTRTRNHFEYPFQMHLHEWQPSVRSEEFPEDVEGLRSSIAEARTQADRSRSDLRLVPATEDPTGPARRGA
jgi:poly-gamma-glutamate synthesis protein (capsule biosynthesis protein)